MATYKNVKAELLYQAADSAHSCFLTLLDLQNRKVTPGEDDLWKLEEIERKAQAALELIAELRLPPLDLTKATMVVTYKGK